MFISECCGCLSEDYILDSVDMCEEHNFQFKYLCLNKQQKCMGNPLACPSCLQSHKGHQFINIENYFTAEFRHILKTGTSLNGRSLARLSQHVLSDINKMRSKLNNQIDKIEQVIKQQIKKLKVKYPLKDKFGIPGSSIGEQNIVQLMNIVQRQKNRIWVPTSENYIRTIVGQVTGMIENLIQDLENNLQMPDYENFNEVLSDNRINGFIKKYQGKYDPDRSHFQFSLFQKHENVRIFQNGIIAKFIDTNPSKPAVLSDGPFDKKNDTFYLKVTKCSKTAFFFDASVVFVGVCLPHIASIFGYRNLIQPSRGAFMVGSNGKTYHSNIQKYNKQSLSFTFGQGDTVSVRVDFDQKKVYFSKWGFFVHNFSMQIDVKDEDMPKLRACVGFHGQKGVLVQIVGEDVFKLKAQEVKYQV